MPSYISVGDTVKINVVFRDWDSDSGYGQKVDPDEVEVNIYKKNEETPHITAEAEYAGSVGEYYYNWTPDESGSFEVEFIGYFDSGDTTVVREYFSVEMPPENYETLLEDQELIFATTVEPLYLDPDEFTRLYEDATRVEIMELIHRYSSEVKLIFKDKPLTITAYEYVRASVMCALARTYDYLAGDASSLTLGDLNISNQSYPRNSITRANATNWCELAAALRQDLIRGEANIKAVVKGTKYTDPMPKRKIKSQYGGNGRRGAR